MAKLQTASATEDGKTQLLQLLEKGGFRYSNQRVDSSTRWRQKIWFVNAVVGRAICEPVMGSTNSCTRTNVRVRHMICVPRAMLPIRTNHLTLVVTAFIPAQKKIVIRQI